MALKRLTGFALSVVLLATIFSSVSSAQLGQKAFRWLGEGYGPGFNRCNPGPNSDYYNPYSPHNSMLISRLPQFQNQNFQSYTMNNLDSRTVYQGIPYSVYAAPANQQNFESPAMNQMNQNSFVPDDSNSETQKEPGEVRLDMDIEAIKPATKPGDLEDLNEQSGFRLQTTPNQFRAGQGVQTEYSQTGFQHQKPGQQRELFNPFAK